MKMTMKITLESIFCVVSTITVTETNGYNFILSIILSNAAN